MILRSRDLKLWKNILFESFVHVLCNKKNVHFLCTVFSIYFVYATDKYDSVIYIWCDL